MTREELAHYIDIFDLYKRGMMNDVQHVDYLIHAMVNQLICDEVSDPVMQNVFKDYYENATHRAQAVIQEMEALTDMYMKLSSKEEES